MASNEGGDAAGSRSSAHSGGTVKGAGPGRRLRSVKVMLGTHEVSGRADVMMVTTLGSCVSACIHDPVAAVGGMNHFLLPDVPDEQRHQVDQGERYGGVAMERLINGMLFLGARRDRLRIKVFGGARVIESSYDIGGSNARFVLEYIKNERLILAAEDLGGTAARRIQFFPETGKVMRRLLRTQMLSDTLRRELRFRESLNATPGVEGEIELFGDQ